MGFVDAGATTAAVERVAGTSVSSTWKEIFPLSLSLSLSGFQWKIRNK